jgi:uncharacterized protein (TIGR00255 family)
MKSMTGFGHAERSLEEMEILVEVRTLNSRYLDIKPRLPNGVSEIEPALRAEIQKQILRGRVDLNLELKPKSIDQISLNASLLQNYLALVDQVREQGVEGEIDVAGLLSFPGVLVAKSLHLGSEEYPKEILQVVREALQNVVAARTAEGEILRRELERRLKSLEAQIAEISDTADEAVEHYREKLLKRIEELSLEVELNEQRLAQELVYYVEKSDISEEISRLKSHISRFHRYLKEGESSSVGKSLDFLCQEMNREINTILSKSNHLRASEIALESKTEIEKIREQVQNVE